MHQLLVMRALACFALLTAPCLWHCTCRTCAEQPCRSTLQFSLVFGEWSSCSTPCGDSTRSVTCQSADGYIGALSQCADQVPQEGADARQTHVACCPLPLPAACSNRGPAERLMQCPLMTSGHVCAGGMVAAGLASLLVQPCQQDIDCNDSYWEYGDWVCDNTEGCGGGTATRAATCVNGTSLVRRLVGCSP